MSDERPRKITNVQPPEKNSILTEPARREREASLFEKISLLPTGQSLEILREKMREIIAECTYSLQEKSFNDTLWELGVKNEELLLTFFTDLSDDELMTLGLAKRSIFRFKDVPSSTMEGYLKIRLAGWNYDSLDLIFDKEGFLPKVLSDVLFSIAKDRLSRKEDLTSLLKWVSQYLGRERNSSYQAPSSTRDFFRHFFDLAQRDDSYRIPEVLSLLQGETLKEVIADGILTSKILDFISSSAQKDMIALSPILIEALLALQYNAEKVKEIVKSFMTSDQILFIEKMIKDERVIEKKRSQEYVFALLENISSTSPIINKYLWDCLLNSSLGLISEREKRIFKNLDLYGDGIDRKKIYLLLAPSTLQRVLQYSSAEPLKLPEIVEYIFAETDGAKATRLLRHLSLTDETSSVVSPHFLESAQALVQIATFHPNEDIRRKSLEKLKDSISSLFFKTYIGERGKPLEPDDERVKALHSLLDAPETDMVVNLSELTEELILKQVVRWGKGITDLPLALQVIKDFEIPVFELEGILQDYPKGMTIENIVEILEMPQIGEQMIIALQGMDTFSYSDHILPIRKAQGEAAFLYFEAIGTLAHERVLLPEDKEYLTYVAKRYGTLARNIVENLLSCVDDISEEREIIEHFITEIGVIHFDVYEQYKAFYSGGDTVGIDTVKRRVSSLQQKITQGEMDDEDFKDTLYPAIAYAVFPPAVGLTQGQYDQLNKDRPDRQNDIPGALSTLQNQEASIPVGKFVLSAGEELNLQLWTEIGKAVDSVNVEMSESGNVLGVDEIDTAEKLLQLYQYKSSNSPGGRAFLFDSMYRFHLIKGGSPLESKYGLSIPELMKYKEFLGEHVKNDLTRDCLAAWKSEFPEKFADLQKKVLSGYINMSIGQILTRLQGVRAEGDEGQKQKQIEQLDTLLGEFGISYADLENKTKAQVRDLLVLPDDISQDDNFTIRLISSGIIGPLNVQMRKEIDKFSFDEEEGMAATRIIRYAISKRREHGVAGYNMGVCVTPDEQLWNDPSFYNVIFFDDSDHIAAGGMHILIREGYVCLPGINPSLDFLSSVDNQALFENLMGYAEQIRSQLDLKGVLIPTDAVIHSNRSQIQQIITSKNYPVVDLEEVAAFSYYPYSYSFQQCYVVS